MTQRENSGEETVEEEEMINISEFKSVELPEAVAKETKQHQN